MIYTAGVVLLRIQVVEVTEAWYICLVEGPIGKQMKGRTRGCNKSWFVTCYTGLSKTRNKLQLQSQLS
jgi:hypothetical protein